MPGRGLSGRAAVVTGAAGGIGRALVRALLAEGADVAALDVNADGLAALRSAMLPESEGRLLARTTDISDYADCRRAVDEAIASFGGLHILINNGAIGLGAIRADHQQVPIGIEEIAPQMWARFVATNFSGAWNMTRAAIAHLRHHRRGRIINVSTSFATMLRGGFHPYGPCKAGLEAMSAGHAEEFRDAGVTVNVVLPGGPVDTPMVPPESGFAREALIAPAVMVPPVLWLCSDAADGVTGNRYVAAHWDPARPPEEAERLCRAPAAWPGLGPPMISPGHRPR